MGALKRNRIREAISHIERLAIEERTKYLDLFVYLPILLNVSPEVYDAIVEALTQLTSPSKRLQATVFPDYIELVKTRSFVSEQKREAVLR